MRRSHRHGFRWRTSASAPVTSTGPKIELYRTWLEEGREPRPVRLIRAGDVFHVRDGRHRITAAEIAGHAVIEADVRDP
jgi:hypothetical protein